MHNGAEVSGANAAFLELLVRSVPGRRVQSQFTATPPEPIPSHGADAPNGPSPTPRERGDERANVLAPKPNVHARPSILQPRRIPARAPAGQPQPVAAAALR